MKIAGKPVVDARKNILLEITKQDVETSSAKDPYNCAVAKACKRLLDAKEVLIHKSMAYIDVGDKFIRFETPLRLQTEIVSFDRGGGFTPGEYTLNRPNLSHKLGSRSNRKARKSHSKSNKDKVPRQYHRIENIRASAHKNIWVKREA